MIFDLRSRHLLLPAAGYANPRLRVTYFHSDDTICACKGTLYNFVCPTRIPPFQCFATHVIQPAQYCIFRE